ncbi:hypothetical protein HD597_007128 [Nonomuraea thailandensis]|uniref:Uncharacterized protein n=1 Tax=Nonomuraea thailandensis TaxID=1188745 RepID=A0A9X2GSK1_9ACTN|nr:hypothetical protein [Nonomuraea thailandensis]MCP2360108.1 hypothetical protein [Nonomuraea thailandensis]
MSTASPERGKWFEHALEWESDPEHGERPARCLVTRIAETVSSALPQVCYRRVDDPGGHRPSSIDIDLFDHILRRWLTAEEAELAGRQARFLRNGHLPSDLT